MRHGVVVQEVHRARVREGGRLGILLRRGAVGHGRHGHVLRQDAHVQLVLERQGARGHVQRELLSARDGQTDR